MNHARAPFSDLSVSRLRRDVFAKNRARLNCLVFKALGAFDEGRTQRRQAPARRCGSGSGGRCSCIDCGRSAFERTLREFRDARSSCNRGRANGGRSGRRVALGFCSRSCASAASQIELCDLLRQ